MRYCPKPGANLGLACHQYNFRYIHMGCSLLTTLVSCPEGVKFLREEDPLLKQIADCLNQLDPVCPPLFPSLSNKCLR